MLDSRIRAAVVKAVQEAGQPPELASKVVAWMEQVAIGNERTGDRDAAARHLDLLFETTVVALESSEDGD